MLFAMRRKLGTEAGGYFVQAERCLKMEKAQDGELEGKIKDVWNRMVDLKARLDVYYSTTFFGKLVRWFDGRNIKWLSSTGILVRIDQYILQFSARHNSLHGLDVVIEMIEKQLNPVQTKEASQKSEKVAEANNSVVFESIQSEQEVAEEKEKSPAPEEIAPIEEKKTIEEKKVAEVQPEKKEHPVAKFFNDLFKKKEPKE